MAFHGRYWSQPIKNGSSDFNYYQWNADGRKNAAKHINSDTRVQPHAEEPLELEPQVRLVCPPSGIVLFSAAQLHSTVPNTSGFTRYSIDFRTVNIEDVVAMRALETLILPPPVLPYGTFAALLTWCRSRMRWLEPTINSSPKKSR